MNILESLVNEAKKKKQQFDQAFSTSPRVVNTAPQQVVQNIQNAKYGVLARNPQQRQQFTASLQAPSAAQQFSAPKQIVPTAIHSAPHALEGFGLGLGRSAIGTGQAVSGLVDLASPGLGTNRVSKLLDKGAQGVDRFAASQHVSPAYKVGQGTGDIAQFLAPGTALKQAANANKVGRAAKLVGNVERYDKGVQGINLGNNAAGRIAAAATRANVSSAGLSNLATGTLLDTGQQASKGRDISPRSVATTLAANAAFNAAPAVAGQGAKELAKGAKSFEGAYKSGSAKIDQNHSIDKQIRSLEEKAQSIKRRVQATPVDNVTANNNLQVKLDRIAAWQDQLKGQKQSRSVAERLATLQPGMSMRPVSTLEDTSLGAFTGKPARSKFPTPVGPPPTEKIAPIKPDAVPVTPQADLPPPGDQLANPTLPQTPAGTVKRTRFTSKTVQNSEQVSPEVKAQTDASYTADTMKAAAKRTEDFIGKNGEDKALQQTLGELSAPRGQASRDTLDRALELAARADSRGDEASQTLAAQLYQLVGEHGSASGQASQILARIARRSPAGLRNKAFRDLKQAGIDVADPKHADLRRHIQDQIDAIASTPDGPAKDFAIVSLKRTVAKQLPQSKTDNVLSVWKAGLLSGVKTQQGNALSNATFGALKKVSDVPATGVDKLLSLKTNQRTVAITGKGIASGTAEGTKTGYKTLRTGIDARDLAGQADKYGNRSEINFKNPVIQKVFGNPANFVFRGMSAADQPFYYAAFKNSLYDQAKADGITNGLHGKALQEHMDQLAMNPTEDIATRATTEATKAVLGNDTVASRAVSAVKRSIDNSDMSPAGKKTASTVINVLAPFVKVPSAFIGRVVDFTPLGIPKTVISQVSHKKFDQRALSQAIGEGATGTGIIALGVGLAQSGLLSGNYPQNDPKEAQRWKAEGITENSVKIGNRWINLNYLGPVGLLFNAGKQVADASAKGENDLTQAFSAVGGLGQGLLGQSFLQGFSGFTNAITDPQRSAKGFVNSELSSVVPAIVNDVANVTDKFQRQADTPLEAVKNRIPGLRETNTVKQDVYGNDLAQAAGQANTLNGIKPSNSLTNKSPAVSEVSRLHSVDPNNKDLQVTPTPVQKTLTVDKQKVKLTDNQREALQKQIGQATQDGWNKLIATNEYKQLSDTEKARALIGLGGDIASAAQRQYVIANNLGTYAQGAKAREAALISGTPDIASYATNASDSSGGTVRVASNLGSDSKTFLTKYNAMSADDRKTNAYNQNDFDYKAAQAKYENDKANGKLSAAEAISRQNELDRAKVGAGYSKDVRELYGLNKDDLYAFLTTDSNGKSYADQLNAYDQALKQSGIIKTAKFKSGFAPKASGKGRNASGLKPSDFKTPYTNAIKSRTKGAQLARSAKLVKRKAGKV